MSYLSLFGSRLFDLMKYFLSFESLLNFLAMSNLCHESLTRGINHILSLRGLSVFAL